MTPRDGSVGHLPRPPLHPLPTRPSFSDRLPMRPSELLKVRARDRSPPALRWLCCLC